MLVHHLVYPPEISENTSNLPSKILLKLWNNVVVYHLEVNVPSDISYKEKWTNYLSVATKSNPDRQFVATDINLVIEFSWLSCNYICSDVVGVFLSIHGSRCCFISNDEAGQKEVLVYLDITTQPTCKQHSPSIIIREKLVPDLDMIGVYD